jgi:transcriptional regulator with XRE-family HTH domain
MSPRERVSDWPDVASDDPSAEVARALAVRLRAAIGERSLRAAGADTGVDHSTIQAILQGRAWPDLDTIARLERGLGADLWPGRPVAGS